MAATVPQQGSTESPCSWGEFAAHAEELKRKKRLHRVVQERLSVLLRRLEPGSAVVSEVSLVKGGRNDLVQFESHGRRAVFEVFVSPSQVPQDLRLLEQATADTKVAVLLDSTVNPKLSVEYFRKKPDNFPYIWVSDVVCRERESYCIASLRELTDHDSAMNRLGRLVSGPAGSRLQPRLVALVNELEEMYGSLTRERGTQRRLTGIDWLSLCVAGRVHQLGVPIERLRPLYRWLKDVIQYATMLVGAGFTVFLVTDMKENHAILTDTDVADELIVCGPAEDKGHAVVCLNKIINDFAAKLGWPKAEARYHFYHTYHEYISKVEYKFEGLGKPPASKRAGRKTSAGEN
ncbi:MAG: hypothetical protein JXA57_00750 [Armatimonadetes bacterium]|nr:hypothetical protein [Armatimonadota bacterium]